jgi:hypothetical protein
LECKETNYIFAVPIKNKDFTDWEKITPILINEINKKIGAITKNSAGWSSW